MKQLFRFVTCIGIVVALHLCSVADLSAQSGDSDTSTDQDAWQGVSQDTAQDEDGEQIPPEGAGEGDEPASESGEGTTEDTDAASPDTDDGGDAIGDSSATHTDGGEGGGTVGDTSSRPFRPKAVEINTVNGQQVHRVLLFDLPSGVDEFQLLPQDLQNDDNTNTLPAASITSRAASTTTLSGQLPFTLTFDLTDVGAGKYKGEMLASYASDNNDAQWLDITVQVKHGMFWPLLFLVFGIIIAMMLTHYRTKGRPRDELLVRLGRLTALIKNDKDLVDGGAEHPFMDAINDHLDALQRAMNVGGLEEAKKALSAAEDLFYKWRKDAIDWKEQLNAQKNLRDKVKSAFAKVGQTAYLVAVDHTLDDAVKNAPTKEVQDLRDVIDAQTLRFNEYMVTDSLIDSLEKAIDDLKDDDKKRAFQATLTGYQSQFKNMAAEEKPETVATLQTAINKTIDEVKASLLMPASAAAVPPVSASIQQFTRVALPPALRAKPGGERGQKQWSEWLPFFNADASTRLSWYRWISMVIAVGLLAGTGFTELYVSNETFGANLWSDYLALFVWGFSAEATRSTVIDLVRGWDVGIVPDNSPTT